MKEYFYRSGQQATDLPCPRRNHNQGIFVATQNRKSPQLI
jgi:hypothetical protein